MRKIILGLLAATAALAAPIAVAGSANAAAYDANALRTSAAGHPNTPVFNDCFASKRRPGHWQLACGDGNGYFDRASWTHWGRTYASGTARLWHNTCRPYCAAGNYHKYRVKVRLDRVGTTRGHTYFKRFRYGRTSLTHSYRLPARPPYPGQG